MKDKIKSHPSLNFSQDIADICNPLKKLKISYFAHVHIDNSMNFSAITNNPKFTEHYLNNKYYNADIHMSSANKFGKYIIWDSIERCGESEKMHLEAADFGIKHTFTIVEKNQNGNDYYHFATHLSTKSINQIYIANTDLLKLFVTYFTTYVTQSKELSSAYDLTFNIDANSPGYTTKQDSIMPNISEIRSNFLKSLPTYENKIIDSKQSLETYMSILTPQQWKCFELLVAGDSAKKIGIKLNLSNRTVEHYLARIRKIFNFQNNKELVAAYYSQIFSNRI